jgi:acyl carrier protein
MATNGRPHISTQDVEDRLLAFIQRELLSPEMTLHPNDELLADGLLDSIAVLRLAAFVEEEFQFKMQPADFVIENFQSVAVLSDYVRRSSEQAGRPQADSRP